MQENEKCVVLVHYNLLNNEKGFEKLREELISLDLIHLSSFDEFSYDFDKDEIVIKHIFFTPDFSILPWIEEKTNEGFVFISLDVLKTFFSIN